MSDFINFMAEVKITPEMLEILEERYAKYWWKDEDEREYAEVKKDPFKLLLFTILSQNTSGINTRRAYKGLKNAFDVSPHSLVHVHEGKIADAIKAGGLHRIKAKRIKEVAEFIMKKWNGNIEKMLEGGRDVARKNLLALLGVGEKTADVVLSSLYGNRDSIVVDTHMKRIAIRLGIVEKNATYKEIQEAIRKIFPWEIIPPSKEERILALFWLMAKHTCDAKKPRCHECILKNDCRYAETGSTSLNKL